MQILVATFIFQVNFTSPNDERELVKRQQENCVHEDTSKLILLTDHRVNSSRFIVLFDTHNKIVKIEYINIKISEVVDG
jgi:hypothetical protein